MHGIITDPKIKDTELDKVIFLARKESREENSSGYGLPVLTPGNKRGLMWLAVSTLSKGYLRLDIDLWQTNCSVNSSGMDVFCKEAVKIFEYKKNLPDKAEVISSPTGLWLDVKKEFAGKALAYILNFLENEKYVEEESRNDERKEFTTSQSRK